MKQEVLDKKTKMKPGHWLLKINIIEFWVNAQMLRANAQMLCLPQQMLLGVDLDRYPQQMFITYRC